MLDTIFPSAPIWLVGVLFFLALFASCVAGSRLRAARAPEQHGDSDGYILSAVLGLLGLLIAFTFSLALSRYDTRREMVVAEGNAISTAWLRATLVGGEEGDALRQSLRGYADIRLRLPAAPDPAAVEREASRQQEVIWQSLRPALARLDPPIAATLVSATTEMFDAAASRKAERDARLPGRVLSMVALYALMAAAITGYVIGKWSDWRDAVVSNVLFVLLALALALILDLDRPWSGSITISPQPVIDARAVMG